MKRQWNLSLLLVSGLTVAAAFATSSATRADDPKVRDHRGKADPKADVKQMMQSIKRDGKLPGGAQYWRHAEVVFKGQKRTFAAVPLNKKVAARTTGGGTRSAMTTVGGEDLPPGFGKGFVWDRTDNEVLLVMFINAADPLGISIEGVQAGDQVQVLAASGIASYAEDKGNPLASSIVGLVAAGAKVVVGAAGAPEVAPAIDAAETFAKDQFKATNAKTKRRDAFGVDPGSGHKAKEEGGVLVCLPEAGGTFYSGDGDHKDRWIKPDGTRSDDHLPAHFNYGAFFPRQGFASHNTRVAQQAGPMYVLPWDWKFEDNAGFYKVFVKLTKGNGPPPVVIERTGAKAKTKSKQ